MLWLVDAASAKEHLYIIGVARPESHQLRKQIGHDVQIHVMVIFLFIKDVSQDTSLTESDRCLVLVNLILGEVKFKDGNHSEVLSEILLY